ncbi:MAG: hypothetical protein LBC63_09815 [Holophagales bacterium]|jgi:hypothetical protein|nr:hypothetical protein [Holophagales bacterium]
MAKAQWDPEYQPWRDTRELQHWRCHPEDVRDYVLFTYAKPIIESLRKKAIESLKEERIGSPSHADHKGFMALLDAIGADTEDALIKLSLLAGAFPRPWHSGITPNEYLKTYTKPILGALRTAFNIQKTAAEKYGCCLHTPDLDGVDLCGGPVLPALNAIQELIASYEREAEALKKKKHVPGRVRAPFQLRWLMADLLSIVKPLATKMTDAKGWTRRIAWAIYEAAGGGMGAMPRKWADPEMDYAVTVNKDIKLGRGR